MEALQASLFEHRPSPRRLAVVPSIAGGIELRSYQRAACDAIDEQLEKVRSTLIVMAVGSGKTTVFSEAIRRRAGRCLVLAHRVELIDQAVARIRKQTGRPTSREKAGDYAWAGSEVVVGSVQSLQGERLAKFGPNEFELVVVDEAHHAPAASYRKILDHFAGAKILGVTATPDRADEQAMGSVFDSVAFQYDIEDGIRDGYLCPVRATEIICGDIDLSDIRTVAGDLSPAQLDDVMSAEKVLHQVAKPTIKEAGTRRTLVFTTSVANAKRLAEVFNRYRPDCARFVSGDSKDRRTVLADHQAGRFQFLINVMVLTEGYDDPAIACVAMARPTKSRALYAQMAGRGTRPAPGKDDLLLLDFVGNTGKHALVSATDILAGKYPDEVVARAKRKQAAEPGKDVRESLAEADEEIEREKAEAARRAQIKARAVAYQARVVDPFSVYGIDDPGVGRSAGTPANEHQREMLRVYKIPVTPNITSSQALALLNHERNRRRKGWCTYAQGLVLARAGIEPRGVRHGDASRLIDALAKNGWRRLTPEQHAAALARNEPGSDG